MVSLVGYSIFGRFWTVFTRRYKKYRPLKYFLNWIALTCLIPGAWAADTLAPVGNTPLMFGVLNQQSPLQTAERWNPILRYLTKKTGIPLNLRIGATVEQTDAMMGREEFDLVFTNHNFQAEFDGKYKILVRWAGNPIHGALIVHEDSTTRSIKDLQGKIVGFPSPEAFVAYAVPMLALKEAKVSVLEKFAGSQDGTLAQLKARQVEAAAINTRFLEQYAKHEHLPYRIIFQSEPFYEMPIAVHPRVTAERVAGLKQALLELADDPLAADIREWRCPGFEMTEEHEYDNVRRVYRMIGR